MDNIYDRESKNQPSNMWNLWKLQLTLPCSLRGEGKGCLLQNLVLFNTWRVHHLFVLDLIHSVFHAMFEIIINIEYWYQCFKEGWSFQVPKLMLRRAESTIQSVLRSTWFSVTTYSWQKLKFLLTFMVTQTLSDISKINQIYFTEPFSWSLQDVIIKI